MATKAQIDANRRNALRSTGPRTAAGRAKSAMNARKHGMRSEREKMAREESIGYENRYMRWAGSFDPETDAEEFLLHSNVFLASEMDRTKAAYIECIQVEIDNAENVEIDEVFDTGNLLFADPRGVPASLYGSRSFERSKPGGPSWSGEGAPVIDPGKLVRKHESSAMGCFWLLGVLEELLERAKDSIWAPSDRLKMIRLLGRQPVDAIDDWRVAEIFTASHAIHPIGKPFDDLECEMRIDAHEKYVRNVRAKWCDLSRKDEPEKARQSLIEIVQTEIERIRDILAEHEANGGEDEARRIRARKGFVFTREAQAMRRDYLKCKGSLERGLNTFRKVRQARKADRDEQKSEPVPGKDISPYNYYGQPASWWREDSGAARTGDGRSAGGRDLYTGAQQDASDPGAKDPRSGALREPQDDALREPRDQGDGGRGFKNSTAEVRSEQEAASLPSIEVRGLETVAQRECRDGSHIRDSEQVDAVSDRTARGPHSVEVEDSDIVACGGYLPEKYVGGRVAEVEAEIEVEDSDGGLEVVGPEAELPPTIAEGDTFSAMPEQHAAPNEANSQARDCGTQNEEHVHVPENSADASELDTEQTKPNLETKPIPAGGSESREPGNEVKAASRNMTESERRAVWMESLRQKWIFMRAEQDRARLQRAVGSSAETATARVEPSGAAGDSVSSQDVRGP